MNNNEKFKFLEELDRQLKGMPFEDKRDAMYYYEQYIDEAEDTLEAIRSLGSPKTLANEIKADMALKNIKEYPRKKGNGLKVFFIVLLSICALPIGLGVAITVIAIVFSIFIGVMSILLSLLVAGASMVLSGILAAVAGIIVIWQFPPTGILYMGVGLVVSVIGFFLAWSMSICIRAFVSFLVRRIAGFRERKRVRKAVSSNK